MPPFVRLKDGNLSIGSVLRTYNPTIAMKTVQIDRYGSPEVLHIVDRPIPEIGKHEVLVRHEVISINPYDALARQGKAWFLEGFRFPKTLGCEGSGVVERVGDDVRGFKPGDAVITFTGRRGAYAEYVALPADKLVVLPSGVSLDEGAALPLTGTCAYDALHSLGKIKLGHRVLIYGASGSMGSFATQLAKHAGAHVTAVTSTPNVAAVAQLGADVVIDYRKTDFTLLPEKYDLVLDAPHVLRFAAVKNCLAHKGTMITTVPSPGSMLRQILNRDEGKKLRILFARPTSEGVARIAGMVARKEIRVIIDRKYPLADIAEAHRYSESGRAKGKILVSFV